MATYKVIQDIEAEDKLLGPLSLRQFIYAIIAIGSAAIIFRLILVQPLLTIPFLPHTILFAVLAAPFGHDQSSEVWLLAKIRFFLKPRRRIWNQSGIQQLVTVTAPKKLEQVLTDGLNQTEVKSRLQALANTIDSRGWAIKNVNVNLFSQPSYVLGQTDSDRLIDPATIPQDVPNFDVQPTEDIFDEQSNPTAQHLNQLMATSEQAHRQQLATQMSHASNAPKGQQGQTPQPDFWFLNQPPTQGLAPTQAVFDSRMVMPGSAAAPAAAKQPTPEELETIHRAKKKQKKHSAAYGHMKTLVPLSQQKNQAQAKPKRPPGSPVTPPTDPAIIALADNDDLNVATIARQANKARPKEPPDDEVVISLR